MHFAFDEFALILWGVKKPTKVMTDNEALTRLFQSKRIPPKLWNYCDQALQFNFVLSHVPSTEKPAADYLSRLVNRPKERIPSSSMTKFQSTTLRSTCHLKPRSKMRTKRTTYPMMTPPPRNSTMPSTPNWTKFPKATTNRVNSFQRGEKPSVIRSRQSSRAIMTR